MYESLNAKFKEIEEIRVSSLSGMKTELILLSSRTNSKLEKTKTVKLIRKRINKNDDGDKEIKKVSKDKRDKQIVVCLQGSWHFTFKV